MHSRFLRH